MDVKGSGAAALKAVPCANAKPFQWVADPIKSSPPSDTGMKR
jgi:hypothetical protein